jgi:ankyrin repeat protein
LLLKCNDVNNIEHQDNDGRTELFWVDDVVQLSYDCDAKIQYLNKNGDTALLFALVYNSTDAAQFLIDGGGVNIEHQSNGNMTPPVHGIGTQ